MIPFFFLQRSINPLSTCLLSSKALFDYIGLLFNIICMFTRSSYFATLSLNRSWIPCTISSDFLTIAWSLFPCSKSFISATINSSFFFQLLIYKTFSFSFSKSWFSKNLCWLLLLFNSILSLSNSSHNSFSLFILFPLGSLFINYPILLISIGPCIPTLSCIANNSLCLHIE